MERRKMVQKIKSPAKGQSLLEFALMLPILLLIVLGVIEFGRIFVLYTEASNAAREAARYGVAAGDSANGIPRFLDCGQIRQAALDTTIISDFDPVTDTIQIVYDNGDNNGILDDDCDSKVLTENDILQGFRIVVTVTTNYEPILPIIPINNLTFNPSSRRTILKDIVIQNDPELPPPPPGCRLLQYTINPSTGGTVTVSPEPNCGGTWYYVNTDVTLVESPNSGYNFSNWGIVNNTTGTASSSTNAAITITMDGNYTVVANFAAIICYQIVPEVNPPGSGTAEVLTPENCPNNTGWIEQTGVLVDADGGVGWEFVDWTDSEGTYTGSTDRPLIIANSQQTSDRTITANFQQPVPDCFDIIETINPIGEGVVNYSPPRGTDCPNGWLAGNVQITAVANEPTAYQFDSWSGDAAANGNSNPGTLGVTGNMNITAIFTQTADVADLFIQKSDSVDPATVGQPFSYTLVIGNNGPDGASDVRVTDTLPPSVSPISATPSQGSCAVGGNVVNCTIGFLAANSIPQTVDITVVPNNVGTILNVASVFNNDPDEIDTNQSNNSDQETTQVLPSADLAVTKSGPANANVGGTLTYNITVSNNGPSAATSVVLVDALPLTVSYLNHTISNGACASVGTQVTCNLGNMPANGTPVNITIQALATAESNAINQVNVSASSPDPDITNNTATATTLIGAGSEPFITISPTCRTSSGGVTVKGYNWPTAGNVDTTIHWDSITNPVLATIPDSVVELGNGLWVKNITTPASSNGLHTIFAHHAQGQGTTESAPILVPCPAPDLTISPQITLISPGPINQGDPVTFRVTVTNTGVTQAVSQFPVSLYFNPNPAPIIGSSTHISNTFKAASFAVSGLPIGASRAVTLTAYSGFPISGTNTVYAVVDSDPDPDGQVNETDETNNISGVLTVDVDPCIDNCGGNNQTGDGILAGQAFVPSVSGELLPQPGTYVLLVGQTVTYTDFTFTDNNGVYGFTDLPTGGYTVSGCISIDGTTYFFAIAVNVTSGLTTEQDLILTQAPCT